MPNLTLAIPADLHRRMRQHPEIRWSELVRQALTERVHDLELMDRIAAKSALVPDQVDEFDHLLKEALQRHYARGNRR